MVASRDIQRQYFFANVLVISLSIAFLVHFGFIAYYGEVLISEPCPLILLLEIIGLIGLIIFAFLNLVKGILLLAKIDS